MRRGPRIPIDWSTVVLVAVPSPSTTTATTTEAPRASSRLLSPRRSLTARILSGGSLKARRGGGAQHSHTQLCRLLQPGVDVLSYGWGLVAAAMASASDQGVKLAVHYAANAICVASDQLVLRAVP